LISFSYKKYKDMKSIGIFYRDFFWVLKYSINNYWDNIKTNLAAYQGKQICGKLDFFGHLLFNIFSKKLTSKDTKSIHLKFPVLPFL